MEFPPEEIVMMKDLGKYLQVTKLQERPLNFMDIVTRELFLCPCSATKYQSLFIAGLLLTYTGFKFCKSKNKTVFYLSIEGLQAKYVSCSRKCSNWCA